MESKPTQRRYDLDWLRVLAFGGVFFFHCARFFNSEDWEMKNPQTSPVADIFTGIFGLWGMPLLFAIAGASIFFALRPGGTVRFLRDRVLRLLVPWAFGILLLAPPQLYLEALTKGRFQGNFFQYLPFYFNGNLEFSGVHLWFLRILFLLTLVLTPLFAWLKRPSGQAAIARLSRFSGRPGMIFLWALPFAILAILVDPFELLRPALPEVYVQCALYFFFPVYGYLIYADSAIQQAIIRQRRAALILALALSPAVPVVSVGITELGWVLGAPVYALMMALVGLIIWSYVLACFGYGMRYLNFNRPLLAYANEAVLPFYILHQPVILIIGFFVIPLALPIAVKYLIITPLAFGITLALYEYGVSRVNVLRRLFGLKPRNEATPTRTKVTAGSSLRSA